LDTATWMAGGALVVTGLSTLFTFLTRRPMVSASAVADLRAEVEDLRDRLRDAGLKIASLEGSLGQAIMEREWWRGQYQAAKIALDNFKSPA
jgi:hypothetical protein